MNRGRIIRQPDNGNGACAAGCTDIHGNSHARGHIRPADTALSGNTSEGNLK
jgi:hypothetical protein